MLPKTALDPPRGHIAGACRVSRFPTRVNARLRCPLVLIFSLSLSLSFSLLCVDLSLSRPLTPYHLHAPSLSSATGAMPPLTDRLRANIHLAPASVTLQQRTCLTDEVNGLHRPNWSSGPTGLHLYLTSASASASPSDLLDQLIVDPHDVVACGLPPHTS
jgi:hypothetical protein